MDFIETPTADLPMDLLLLADPNRDSISSYLTDAWGFAAVRDGEVVGACVASVLSGATAEIYNIAVSGSVQNQGVGTRLLAFVLAQLRAKGIARVELGTGTFGYQLTYYQRAGFRVAALVKDHFIDNYPEPIYEDGIRHQDMLRLYIEL